MRNATITVEMALLSIRAGGVSVVVDKAMPAQLPIAESAPSEGLDQAAWAVLAQITGSRSGYLEQLYTFSFHADGEQQIVVSYLALVPAHIDLGPDWVWQDVPTAFSVIGQNDQLILEYALIRLRAKIGYTTIAFHLLPESFSLSELQQTYETILSRPLDPRNFRRRIVSTGFVEPENRQRRDGSHRPAALYRFSGAHDPASYLTPLALSPDHNDPAQAKGIQ
ncbi:MAG TPA: hypothetical protein PK691_06885 [Thermomicrobiales bacterium]|nr:hypothetical protein [Thermomicrobiales bacterium]HRA49015.1 hypothetical protein [Thermomicrobiales bacterium]